jgi:hypothetical protein
MDIDIAKTSALVVPAPEMKTIVVRGRDRTTWLNGLVTCDVAKATEGEALYGLVVTKKGRITADLVIVPRREELVLVADASVQGSLLEVFDHHLVMEDVELAKDSPHVFFIHGPRSNEVRVPNALFARLDRTGLGGAIAIANEDVSEALAHAASAVGGAMGDDEAWEQLRIERGVPRFGRDFDDQTYPQEAALEKIAVSFDKGCYLGQEVVCMLELRGHVKRKLVRVALSVRVAVGTSLTDDKGAEVGKVTSVAQTGSKVLGLAMVKLAQTAPGATLRAGEATATVL